MFGGDYLSSVKEWFNNTKIKFINFLTPVAYTEYVIKMLFILRVKNLFGLLKVNIIIHLVMLVLSIIKPIILSRGSIVLSLIFSTLLLGGFILYRATLRKAKIDIPDVEVVPKPLDPIDVEVPSRLKQFLNEEDVK